jgi:hypothetical protein
VDIIQEQALREIIARNRRNLATPELFILAPGLGEDAVIDGVPVYGEMAYSMTGHPPGTCIVMTRATWERNLETLAPLLSGPMLGQIDRWLSQPIPGGSTSL